MSIPGRDIPDGTLMAFGIQGIGPEEAALQTPGMEMWPRTKKNVVFNHDYQLIVPWL